MPYLRLLWRHLEGATSQLYLLQGLTLLRAALGSSGFMLIVPFLTDIKVLDSTDNPRLQQFIAFLPEDLKLTTMLGLFLCLMIGAGIINYVSHLLAEKVEQQVTLSVRKEIYSLTLTAEWQYLAGIHKADYARIQSEEVEAVTGMLDYLLQLVTLLLITGVYLALSFFLSPALTTVAIALGVLMILVALPVQKMIAASGMRHLQATEQLYRRTGEQIDGIREIKGSAAREKHVAVFNNAADAMAQEEINYTRISGLTQLANGVVGAVAFCMIAYVALGIMNVELAVLTVVGLIFSRIMPQISRLQTILQRVSFLLPSLQEVLDHLEHLRAAQEQDHPAVEIDFTGGITLQKAGYEYPGSDSPALVSVSAELAPNQLILVKGTSGIGKSTLADLLSGLSIPTRGSISASGICLDRDTCLSWRRSVTYVPQKPFLIDASIRENLCLLTNEAPEEEQLILALHQAQASFAIDLPEGLDTPIGEDGKRLSAGERQRIVLARALLMAHQLIILDESMSNLDATSEEGILNLIQTLKRDRTFIVISHKSTLDAIADQVIIIDQPTSETG